MTENEKIQEMVELSKIDNNTLQSKRFFEAYSIEDALEIIAKLHEACQRQIR